MTLHGSLIDISGAMTGGGGKVMHGAIKTIQQDPKPSTIDSIQLELDSLYAQLGHLELQKVCVSGTISFLFFFLLHTSILTSFIVILWYGHVSELEEDSYPGLSG